MRLVAWNLNHRIRARPIVPAVAEALAALAPDVIVLTEYVAHESHASFFALLADHGLPHVLVSEFVAANNRVLIASRWELEAGCIRAPALNVAIPSNVLHVVMPTPGFSLLGVRMPDFGKLPAIRRAWWDWLERTAVGVADSPSIMAGDFNTDTSYPKARCGDRPGRLVQAGWQHAAPAEGSSYFTLRGEGKRIDHAFLSKHFMTRDARYVTESAGHRLIGKPAEALSDHAALVIDFERMA